MTTYITTKEAAALLRKDLATTFPGVKFSVRKSTGTASAWISVSWTDGPTSRDVDAVKYRYQGRQFNGMTDGYDDLGTALISIDSTVMPEEFRYLVDGINTQRDFSPAVVEYSKAQARRYVDQVEGTWEFDRNAYRAISSLDLTNGVPA
jgi:hypothetical protein